MAVENRGGPNGGPQYNQANVNPMGGNGQSGRMDLNYSGLPYGQNKSVNEQRTAAPIKSTTPTPKAAAPKVERTMPMVEARPLTAPSDFPEEDITTGAPIGSTPGPETLALPQEEVVVNDPDLDLVREYFPIIELWAEQVDTSQGTKDYVNYLRTIL